MNYHPTIKRLIRKAENLERKVEFDLRKKGVTHLETYRNRCLLYAEKVNDLTQVPERQKVTARRRIFKVYFNLQESMGTEAVKRSTLKICLATLTPL